MMLSTNCLCSSSGKPVVYAGAYAIAPVAERAASAAHMQLISGCSATVYWGGHAVFDGVTHALLSAITLAIFAAFGDEATTGSGEKVWKFRPFAAHLMRVMHPSSAGAFVIACWRFCYNRYTSPSCEYDAANSECVTSLVCAAGSCHLPVAAVLWLGCHSSGILSELFIHQPLGSAGKHP